MVIAFLPRTKHLLIAWLQSQSAVILEPKKIVCQCFHCFPIYLPWSDGMGCHDLSFLNVEFQASFFTLLFHFHQDLFSSSSLSAIKVVSSVYLKLLIFLLAILATVHGVMATTCSPRLQSMGSHRGRRRVQPAEGTVPELAPFCSTLLTSLGLFTHQRCWGSHGGSRPPSPSQSCVGTKW